MLLPSIGGIDFAIRSLEKGDVRRVQIIETSDPLFSTLFAFFIFGEVMGRFGAVGAAFIMAGRVVSLLRSREPVLTSP
ncbi:EamA family transporter [Lonsdalea britannica]|uniref:EamA family transporter n=1 Tax=Lonsdalea britannica TaxID=1082704 RepID=UPI0013C2BA2F|nr:EamA family transporter [Lonsdalea britannica]